MTRAVPWLVVAAGLGGCTSTAPLKLEYDAARSEMVGASLLLNGFNETGICHLLWVSGEGDTLLDIDCEPGHRIFRAKPSRDGRSLFYASNVVDEGLVAEGYIQQVPLSGGTALRTPAPLIHHDFVELDEGFAYLSYVEEQHRVDGRWTNVATDAVIEVPAGGGAAVTTFDFFADYPREPQWTCWHMRAGGWLPSHNDWTHTNSLVEHPDGDAWVLMPRWFDAALKVDRTTGEVIWQLGGRDDRFGLTAEDDALLSHPHMSHAFADRLLVFDNGSGHGAKRRDRSRVVEYRVDEDALTAELVWSYEAPTPRRTGFLGDAKRLPGGNTLVVWSDRGQIHEVTPEGDIVWALELPYGQNTGRVEVMGLELP